MLALSKIIRLPLACVVSTGLKVTDALQLLPGLSVFVHCDFTANTDGDVLSILMFIAGPFLPLAFVIFTV